MTALPFAAELVSIITAILSIVGTFLSVRMKYRADDYNERRWKFDAEEAALKERLEKMRERLRL